MSFWSAIANFFKGFFRSIPALVTGILVGWACVPCHIVVAGILGGVAAAVVNTAINGGNWGQAIGMGAVLGGVIGGIGGDVFKAFGGVAENGLNWANFVAGVKTGAAFGAVIGGISTAIHGGNVFQNVAMGALSGAVSSAAAFGIMKGATEAWNAWKTPAVAPAGGHQVFGRPQEWEGKIPEGLTLRNPTGGDIRLRDDYGDGYYGAPRGGRFHAGLDIVGDAGQKFELPFEGSRQTFGKGFDQGVMVSHSSGQYRVLLLHGDAQTMEVLNPAQYGYRGMTPHIHFQLEQFLGGHWRNVNPTPFLFPSQR